jgi:hypothetical protein
VATQPDDLDDELDPDIVGEGIGEEDLEDDELPEGFIVEGVDVETTDDDDEGSTVVPVIDVAAEDPDDDFADELALSVVVGGGEDEDEDIAVKRSGEFICARCYLVKSNSQIANRKHKYCRDCA